MPHCVCSHMYVMRYWKPELIPCARKWMTHFFCWSSKPLCSHYSPFPLRLGFDDSVALTVSLRVTEPHLRWTVEEARRGSLRLRVGQLHRELEAQREVAGHEEPGHANTHRITDTHRKHDMKIKRLDWSKVIKLLVSCTVTVMLLLLLFQMSKCTPTFYLITVSFFLRKLTK